MPRRSIYFIFANHKIKIKQRGNYHSSTRKHLKQHRIIISGQFLASIEIVYLFILMRPSARKSIKNSAFPSLQHPLAIFIHQKILVVTSPYFSLDFFDDIMVQWQLPEASLLIPSLPLLVSFWSLNLFETFTCYYIHNISSKHLNFIQQTFLIFLGNCCLKHIEKRRVIV